MDLGGTLPKQTSSVEGAFGGRRLEEKQDVFQHNAWFVDFYSSSVPVNAYLGIKWNGMRTSWRKLKG